jgi:hypothetical protein
LVGIISQIGKSNFIDYNKKLKNGELVKDNLNQFIKAKRLGLEKKVSEDTKKKISNKKH